MSRIFLILAILAAPASANAAVTIDWTGATITTINAQSATVTGFTIGDVIVPYVITITSVVSPQDVSFAAPLGANPEPLNLNLPATRQATTLMTVSIALGGGRQMVNPRFTLLDIDVSPSASSFSDWQDLVTMQNAGVAMTSVNAAYTTVSGNTVRGINGNVENDENFGNVNVVGTGLFPSLVYTYGPGPGDGLGSNQRHGISAITMDAVVPEPSTWAMLGISAALFGFHARRKGWRLRKAA